MVREVNIIIDPTQGYIDDEDWEANRRSLEQQERFPHQYSQRSGIGRDVDETAEKISRSAYRSSSKPIKEDSLFSNELFLVGAIMLTKLFLWMLYRAGRQEGLEITDL